MATNICDAILAQGVRDFYSSSSAKDFDSVLFELFSQDYEKTKQTIFDGSYAGSVPIPIAENFFNLDFSSQTTLSFFENVKEKVIAKKFQSISDHERAWINSSLINKDIVNAWSECVGNRKDALAIEVEAGDITGNEFTLSIGYDKPMFGLDEIVIEKFIISPNLSYKGNLELLDGMKLKSGNAVFQEFKRTDDSEAYLILDIKDSNPLGKDINHKIIIPKKFIAPLSILEKNRFISDSQNQLEIIKYEKLLPQFANCTVNLEFELVIGQMGSANLDFQTNFTSGHISRSFQRIAIPHNDFKDREYNSSITLDLGADGNLTFRLDAHNLSGWGKDNVTIKKVLVTVSKV